MPVDFLTPEQEAKYGCFSETPTSEQLEKYFWLDDKDKEFIWNRKVPRYILVLLQSLKKSINKWINKENCLCSGH